MVSITVGRALLREGSIIIYAHATNAQSQVVHDRRAVIGVISHRMVLGNLLRRKLGRRKCGGLRRRISRGGGRILVQINVKTLRRETRLRPSKRLIVLNIRVLLCHRPRCEYLLTHGTWREGDTLRDADLSWPALMETSAYLGKRTRGQPFPRPLFQMTYQRKLACVVIRPCPAIGSPSFVHIGAKRNFTLT